MYNITKQRINLLKGDIAIFFASLFWNIAFDRVFFGNLLPFHIPDNIMRISFYALVLSATLFIYVVSLKAIMKLNEENSYMLFFIRLTIYILAFLISFGFIYSFVDRLYPGAFKGAETLVDYFYYSIVTFTTVGFGDISPVYQIAKIFTMWEIMSSYLFIVLIIGNIGKLKENLGKTNKEAYLEAYEDREK
ncbi:MAG: potassium channel family protein [Candidatus Gracilibacteria bacterium]|nr:potassium channel family protein [Candidatus Gracilibacteria bacterium]